MKKITPVFGPQELFDGCLNDVVCVSKNYDTGEIFQYTSIVIALRDLTKYKGDSDFTVAMRRIEEVPEPKRWTWEDKKAGRLPEVGVSVVGVASHNEKFVVYVDDYVVVVKHKQDKDIVIVFNHSSFLTTHNPIETPAEKSQREEDEFVTSITKCTATDGYSSGYIEGLRTAYRNLKGGKQ